MVNLSARFTEAIAYAVHQHDGQLRKGTGVPYVSHLLAVCAIVLENGGDEDQAVAALLHDAVEDQGGLETLGDINERFGERVARIVDECSDAYGRPKPPWKKRKTAYIDKIAEKSEGALLVSLADKVSIVFTSTAIRHGDEETAITSFNTSLLHLGLNSVRVHCTCQELMKLERRCPATF